MVRNVLTALLLVCSVACFGQRDSTKGFAATFTFSTVPIGQPGLAIQPGAEYRFNERYALLGEVTIPVNHKTSPDSTELNKRYLKFKTELRYSFLSKKTRWSHEYIGLQFSHSQRTFTNRSGFYYDDLPGDSVYFYSSADINSPVTTASVQFGSIITDGHFALDAFLGVGARFIHTTISNEVSRTKGIRVSSAEGFHFTSSYSYAGNKTMLHLTGGVRFIWHFYDFKHPRKQ